jgi:hypothetical protein
LDEPLVVVLGLEFEQSESEFLDGGEVSHPEEVFLQCADEAFGTAVAFGLADEAG